MSSAEQSNPPQVSPRLRRAMELVYGVEGVTEARIWQWSGRVAVGVSGARTVAAHDLLRRVEAAVAPMREPDESWDFGLLGDDRR